MLMFMLGIFFVSSVQPIFMISNLIIIILLYSYMIRYVLKGYWFSYTLMMVMLSGVLVIFTYMVTLTPNESFENHNLLFLFMLLFVLGLVGDLFFYENFSLVSLVLWNSYVGLFSLFLVSFLLGVMLLVVWFSSICKGAIRVE